jgi:tRNA threonylcarbamoyladenosine modification (KEOPS) complex  Pcc1 subunit
MQDRQRKLDEMRAKLAASIALEEEAIQRQAQEARVTLEVEAGRIAVEIGARVLSRPITHADMN